MLSLEKLLQGEGLELRSKFIETSGPAKKIHYLEYGSGDPLILVHGGGANCSIWFNIIRRLQEHYHLYVLDRPGCGLSDPYNYNGANMITHPSDFLESFTDALDLKNVMVAGASIGGYFTARYAIRNPDRISKLIFMGAPAGLENGSHMSRKLLSIKNLNTFIRNSLVKPTPDGSRRMFRNFLVHDSASLPEELYDCYYLGGLIPGAENSYRSLLINMASLNGNGFLKKKYRINDELSTFRKPVLFIWGSGDLFASPDVGRSIVERMGNARIDIIDDAGHAPWLDKPDECVDKITGF